MKRYLYGLVLLLFISLCGCNNGSGGQQIEESTGIIGNTTDHKEESQNSAAEDIQLNASDDMSESDLVTVYDAQKDIYNSLQDNMSVSELTGKTEVIEAEPLEMLPELKEIMFGNMGNLDIGTLAYTVPDKDDEDYRLYFFQSEEGEDVDQLFTDPFFNLTEASYTFPDAREGNVPIGRFKEIYLLETGDVQRDGTHDILAIAVYEKDGNEYYDTRVYEAGESGYVVDTALTQELNEKYYNVKDYPVHEIVALPDDSQN